MENKPTILKINIKTLKTFITIHIGSFKLIKDINTPAPLTSNNVKNTVGSPRGTLPSRLERSLYFPVKNPKMGNLPSVIF